MEEPSPAVCAVCAQVASKSARFCRRCGGRLPSKTEDERDPEPPPAR